MFSGHRISVCDDEKALETDASGYTTLYLMPLNSTLKSG